MTNKSTKDFNAELFDYGLHSPTRTIDLIGEINEESLAIFLKSLHILTSYGKGPITINICSDGGCVFCGLAMYDALVHASQAHETIGVVQGKAMSMASVILQGCTTRVSRPSSTIMAHGGSGSIEGSPDEIRSWSRYGDKVEKLILDIYSSRSFMTRRTWRNRLKSEWILTAEEALKAGIIDEINT